MTLWTGLKQLHSTSYDTIGLNEEDREVFKYNFLQKENGA